MFHDDDGVERAYTSADAVESTIRQIGFIYQCVTEQWGRMDQNSRSEAWAMLGAAETRLTVRCLSTSKNMTGSLAMLSHYLRSDGATLVDCGELDIAKLNSKLYDLWSYVRQVGVCRGTCLPIVICDVCNSTFDTTEAEDRRLITQRVKKLWLGKLNEESAEVIVGPGDNILTVEHGMMLLWLNKDGNAKLADKLRKGLELRWSWPLTAQENLSIWIA